MDVPSWAFKGNRVVCVDDRWDGRWWGCPLIKDGTYTIRAILPMEDYSWSEVGPTAGVWALDLVEASNPTGVVGFHINRFRPLVSQQDDIKTHFQALLDQPMREVV